MEQVYTSTRWQLSTLAGLFYTTHSSIRTKFLSPTITTGRQTFRHLHHTVTTANISITNNSQLDYKLLLNDTLFPLTGEFL